MFDDHTDLSGSYVPYQLNPPGEWPRLLSWVKLCRENAISVFPYIAYEQFRAGHQSLGRKLCRTPDVEACRLDVGRKSSLLA